MAGAFIEWHGTGRQARTATARAGVPVETDRAAVSLRERGASGGRRAAPGGGLPAARGGGGGGGRPREFSRGSSL